MGRYRQRYEAGCKVDVVVREWSFALRAGRSCLRGVGPGVSVVAPVEPARADVQKVLSSAYTPGQADLPAVSRVLARARRMGRGQDR